MNSTSGSSHLGYWYGTNNLTSNLYSLPLQAVPKSRKNNKWKEATMDSLEAIGLRQLSENVKFVDVERMMSGKISFMELSEVIPEFKELGSIFDSINIPQNIKHYDFLRPIQSVLVGEFLQQDDKFNVTNVDEISTNEYQREKKGKLVDYIGSEFQKELNKRLLEMGINPNPESEGIQNPQELQARIQEVEQQKQAMTPPEIESYMNYTWKTFATRWGEHTIEFDTQRFNVPNIYKECFEDKYKTGRCFIEMFVGYDFYKPRRWSPINTFFSQDVDTKFVQDGDYVGRIHYYTPSQIINNYGHLLTEKQKKDILGGDVIVNGKRYTQNDLLAKQGQELEFVPFEGYRDYNLAYEMEQITGIPLGEQIVRNEDGSYGSIPTFHSNLRSKGGYARDFVRLIRSDLNLRSDLYQVTEAYWISYKRVGNLTYMTPEGRVATEVVTEDILSEFLKANGITTLHNITMEELSKEPEVNTIVWDYVPESWKGIKISGGYLQDALYLGIEPTPYQIRGDSNVFDVKLPVSGYVGQPLVSILLPYQVGYNIATNQAMQFAERDVGMFLMFDIGFLPDTYKNTDTEASILRVRNLIRDLGILPIDGSRTNLQGGSMFNQFSVQNMSFGNLIVERLQIAEMFKQKAYEQLGVTPQRMGQPVAYQTAEGTRQAQVTAHSLTENEFDEFSLFQKRTWELHLAVAQYCQKNEKDITVHYSKSDGSLAFLRFSDPDFHLRKLGILPTSNTKSRRVLDLFKQMMLQRNTLGTDEEALLQFVQADSTQVALAVARDARMRQEKAQQDANQHQLQMIQAQNEADTQREMALLDKKYHYESQLNNADNLTKIRVEEIESYGRAVDNNADVSKLNFINQQANLAIQGATAQGKLDIESRKLDLKEKEIANKFNAELGKYELALAKLNQQRLSDNTKLQIARTNKN